MTAALAIIIFGVACVIGGLRLRVEREQTTTMKLIEAHRALTAVRSDDDVSDDLRRQLAGVQAVLRDELGSRR